MSLRHLATTIFDAGKLKSKYLFKKLFIFRKIPNIHSKQIFIFFQIQNIHSQEIFIFFKIQNIHSKKLLFFFNPEYSFKKVFIFFKRGRIGQGYGDLVLPVLHQREGQSLPSPFAPEDEE